MFKKIHKSNLDTSCRKIISLIDERKRRVTVQNQELLATVSHSIVMNSSRLNIWGVLREVEGSKDL